MKPSSTAPGQRGFYRVSYPPAHLILPAAIAAAFLTVPLLYAAWRVDYAHLFELLSTHNARDALRLSLVTCAASTAVCVIIGAPLALWLAQSPATWWTHIVRTLAVVPMVVPPVVSGLILLLTFGRRGLLGGVMRVAGVDVTFTTAAVILAQSFVALPFLVVSFESALRSRGFSYEHAARRLGASRNRVFWTVTVPLSAPALASAAALALSRCLGEFGATVTFAGSLQGVTRTLPLEIYLQTERSLDTALALSLTLVATAIVAVGGSSLLSAWWEKTLLRPAVHGAARVIEEAPIARCELLPPLHDAPTPGVQVTAVVPERGLDANLEFPTGQTTALLGANGVGKTTVLSLVAGVYRHPCCRVRWLRPDNSSRACDIRPPSIALLDQQPTLLPHLSVLGNVTYGLRAQGVTRAKARQRACAELRGVGVEHLRDRRVRTLSGGQAQCVALAQALALQPEVMLLDEPFTALDEHTVSDLRDSLRYRLRHTTTVLVTHDREDVNAMVATPIHLQHRRRCRREGEMPHD